MSDAAAPPALSAAEADASAARTPPSSERIADGVSTVALPLPPGPNVPYTLAYVIADADGSPHLVDAGTDSTENLERVERALASRGWTLADLRSIIVTHLHTDHLGLAGRLRDLSGAPVVLSRAEQASIDALVAAAPARVERERDLASAWGVPDGRVAELLTVAERTAHVTSFTADVLVDDEEVLPVPGRTLRAVVTPGHTAGHLCIVDDASRLVFTGDHVLPTVFSGLGLGGPSPRNALSAMRESLRRIAGFDALDVCPGHEYRFRGLAERCARIDAHHLHRSREIAAARDARPDATVYEIASRVSWSPGWDNMRGFVLHSALQQTAMHLEHLEQEEDL